MKRFVISVIAVLLLMSIFCVQAFAYGAVTRRNVDAFVDEGMTVPLGTIPIYTAVTVRDNDGATAKLLVNGKKCYVDAGALTMGAFDHGYKGASKLLAGSVVRQRPTDASRGLTIGYDRYVLVYAVRGDWVLIRRSLSGSFAYTHRSNLKGFIRAK